MTLVNLQSREPLRVSRNSVWHLSRHSPLATRHSSSRHAPLATRHSGFTLVEMLVAMTLMIFVMLILSQCFVQGLETFSGLKAIGDMQEDLRTAANILRADLNQDHFEGKRRLSDAFLAGLTAPTPSAPKFREGFFEIGQGYSLKGGSSKQREGAEDGINTYRATDNWLHFTVKLRGNAKDRFFTASAGPRLTNQLTNSLARFGPPGSAAASQDAMFVDPNNPGVFHSAWGEIAYVLLPTGTVLTPGIPPPARPRTPAPTNLYALYRCQYAVIPDTTAINLQAAGAPANYRGIAHANGTFLSPSDLAKGLRTFSPIAYFATRPLNNNNPPDNAALVLSNVISFEVNVSPTSSPDSFGLLPGNLSVFDSANYGTSLAPNYVIKGIEVILRIWDPASRQTRQVTVIQDM